MVSLDLPPTNEVLTDAFFAGLLFASIAASVGNPPLGVAIAATGTAVVGLNIGDPFAMSSVADRWQHDLADLGDVGLNLRNDYTDLVQGAWTGDANAAFLGYLERINGISGEFDKLIGDIHDALNDYAIAVGTADIAMIGFIWACGSIMAALAPGMVPVGETAPAISAIAVQLLVAFGTFAAAILILGITGAQESATIHTELDNLLQKIWKDGKRDANDVLNNNLTVIKVPPLDHWAYDPTLKG